MSLKQFKADMLEVAANPPIDLISDCYGGYRKGKLCGCPLTNLAIHKGWLTEETLRSYFESRFTFEGSPYMEDCEPFIAQKYDIELGSVSDFVTRFDTAVHGQAATLYWVAYALEGV